jgi:uncharacterized pyridoxamine 5'-phosphate oxidase family protein
MAPNGQWLRLFGKAVFDLDPEAKVKAFENVPSLAAIYHSPDNPVFKVFYLSEGKAIIYSIDGIPKEVECGPRYISA